MHTFARARRGPWRCAERLPLYGPGSTVLMNFPAEGTMSTMRPPDLSSICAIFGASVPTVSKTMSHFPSNVVGTESNSTIGAAPRSRASCILLARQLPATEAPRAKAI